jgi:type VI secretion system secreted protein VgrG
MSPATVQVALDAGLTGSATITALEIVERVRATKVTLRDRDWKRPALDLQVSAEAANVAGAIHGEIYDPAGDYVEAAEGKRRAKNRLDALVAASTGARGQSTVPAMAAGHAFTMSDAFDASLDGEWVATRVEHAWSAAAGASEAYSNRFEAIPKRVHFRPLLRAPVPRIFGPQTAIVTGPAGQEIHADSHGRVKLKFPWDRHSAFDDKSSGWARVAQTEMTGSMAIPRVGWEVLVEFERGDPNRPVVVGRLFNGAYPPPYALPQHQTRSTLGTYTSPGGSGHNEIRIEDAAGSEHFHVHAQRDLVLAVANARDEQVGSSEMTSVKNDASEKVVKARALTVGGTLDVTVGGAQKLSVGSKRETTVKKDAAAKVIGDRQLDVTGSHTIATDSDGALSTGGDVEVTIAAGLEETAGGALRIAIGDDASWTVGGPWVESAKKGRRYAVGGKLSSTIGGAASTTSTADLSLVAGGNRSVTVGAAWTVTAGGDVVLSSGDALEITVGAALAFTGAETIALKVGGSKVTIGQGGIAIDAPKIKMTSDGPAVLAAAIVASK